VTHSSKKRLVTHGMAPAVLALAGSLALSACGASNETSATSGGSGAANSSSAKQLSGSLNGAGSSAQQAAMQVWTAGFSSQQPGVTVNYDPVGSGGGREQFLSGGVAFAGSDGALADDEATKAQSRCGSAGYFELPDYISPIALVYNLPAVKDLQLSPDTAAKIFSGKITTWNDPAIKADNPNANLPGTTITPVHRSDESGTTKNFTDWLHQAAPSTWTSAADQVWPVKGGEAGAQTSGMVAAVKAGAGAIGYADESQAGGLQVAKIKVGSAYVAPSAEGAAKVVSTSKQVTGRSQYDHALTINRTTTDSSEYPLVLVSYHIGCVKYPDQSTADDMKAFFTYVVSADGQQAAAKSAGSAPISDSSRQTAMQAIDAIKSGS
jgi:phosphate transport system substrate-binding protein